MRPKRLLYFVNSDWFFVSHRLVLAQAAIADGYEVHLVTAFTEMRDQIESEGIRTHHVPINRSGMNLFQELMLIARLFKTVVSVKPGLMHLITPKCVIYGGLVARLCGNIPTVAAITGLGTGFTLPGVRGFALRRLIPLLYRAALGSRRTQLIFQNNHDLEIFRKLKLIHKDAYHLIAGSGVDLTLFKSTPEPEGTPVVTFASRLLREKGVTDFIDAAQDLHEKGIYARWIVAGRFDTGNRTGVTAEELQSLDRHKIVEVIGFCSDLPDLLARSTLFVFPSYYREGIPKVLLEAAAAGRAVVTTTNPGCIDGILPGISGIAVPPRDSTALSAAIQELLTDPQRRNAMGREGRRLAEKCFSVEGVKKRHLEIYRGLTQS